MHKIFVYLIYSCLQVFQVHKEIADGRNPSLIVRFNARTRIPIDPIDALAYPNARWQFHSNRGFPQTINQMLRNEVSVSECNYSINSNIIVTIFHLKSHTKSKLMDIKQKENTLENICIFIKNLAGGGEL